jgi:hypothetical protein
MKISEKLKGKNQQSIAIFLCINQKKKGISILKGTNILLRKLTFKYKRKH